MTPQGREVNKQMKLEDFSKSESERNSLRTAPDGDLCFKRRAPRTISDVYRKGGTRYEKQDYQDNAVDGSVARSKRGFGPGRYFAGPALLSPDESRTVSPTLEVKPINANSAEFRQECPEPILQILNSKAQFPPRRTGRGRNTCSPSSQCAFSPTQMPVCRRRMDALEWRAERTNPWRGVG
jgi:hypothetical protein